MLAFPEQIPTGSRYLWREQSAWHAGIDLRLGRHIGCRSSYRQALRQWVRVQKCSRRWKIV